MEDIEHHEIPIYNFPYDVEEDDEETIQDNVELRVRISPSSFIMSLTCCKALLPFAIIGSEEEVVIDGESVRARVFPWGVAVVDDPKHCDFGRLRHALLS